MSGAIATVDAKKILERADKKYAAHRGDDPAPDDFLGALAHAVQQQIIDPLIAGTAAAPGDPDELEVLRRKLAGKDAEINHARAERDTARGLLKDATAAPRPDAAVLAEVEQLRDALAKTTTELNAVRTALKNTKRDLDYANRTLDELADEHTAAPHRHAYPIAKPGEDPQPCACREPYPRTNVVEDEFEVRPDVEPFAALLTRVRDELDTWPA